MVVIVFQLCGWYDHCLAAGCEAVQI